MVLNFLQKKQKEVNGVKNNVEVILESLDMDTIIYDFRRYLLTEFNSVLDEKEIQNLIIEKVNDSSADLESNIKYTSIFILIIALERLIAKKVNSSHRVELENMINLREKLGIDIVKKGEGTQEYEDGMIKEIREYVLMFQ